MPSISKFLKMDKPKLLRLSYIVLNIIILADIIAIVYLMIFDVPANIKEGIILFDLFVCAILLIEFSIKFHMSKPKKIFMKNNWLDLIASIPLDLILPLFSNSVRFLKLIRVLKLLRVIALFRKYFKGLDNFIENTSFDKIVSAVIITIVAFTLLIYISDPTIDLFESFWFVVVTVTTVGYGDITPTNFNGRVLALLLILVGIFVFSIITGAISSIFTDRLLKKENKSYEMKDILDNKINPLADELKELRQENKELKDEILDLKELIKKDD